MNGLCFHTYGSQGGRAWPVVSLNLWYLVGCWCMSCWELGGLDDILGGLALCCQGSCIQMAIRELSFVMIWSSTKSALFWQNVILYKKLVFKSKHFHVLLFQLQFEAKQCLFLANRLESNLPLLPHPHPKDNPKSPLDFTGVSWCKNDYARVRKCSLTVFANIS